MKDFCPLKCWRDFNLKQMLQEVLLECVLTEIRLVDARTLGQQN